MTRSLFDLVCEPGTEVYFMKNKDKLNETLGFNIMPTFKIIENYFNHFENYSLSLNEIFNIIHSSEVLSDVSSYNIVFNKLFLPTVSLNYSIGIQWKNLF